MIVEMRDSRRMNAAIHDRPGTKPTRDFGLENVIAAH
jgi:hypothetical protein